LYEISQTPDMIRHTPDLITTMQFLAICAVFMLLIIRIITIFTDNIIFI
jgi:hypothetical protein